MRILAFLLCVIGLQTVLTAQNKTYCNPINVDYGYTPIPDFAKWGKHRATADPVIVNYKGDYYLFSTNQWGYWWSKDLSNWNFVSRKFLRPWNKSYDELCAPAVGIVGDTMIVFGSTYTSNFTLWMSTNPKDQNSWQPLVDSFEIGGWDPAFFTDDDGRFYMYNGSSNRWPLYGIELNKKNFSPIGTRKELYFLEDWRYGWQRFGEHQDNTFLNPFIEGAWMTKHHGKYYLQYGAPGTEFSGYADGVAVGDSPLGWFQNQSDPLSYKAGGFARGAGHGSTFQDKFDEYWHTSTISISVKNNFERRIGIWPAGFDQDDVMYCNTSFGDYPHYLPVANADHSQSLFTGWMLLNYKKPVRVSSTLGGYSANHAVDENIKTYWSAQSADKGEFLESDLGTISDVRAIQVNFADQDVEFLGKSEKVAHQYKLWYSLEGTSWKLLVDKSNAQKDVPHDYNELPFAVKARFIKIENVKMPTGKFAISGFRVFGNGLGKKPVAVSDLYVLRTEKDKRSAWLKWTPNDLANGYNIYYGTNPDKLYTCIMVHDQNDYWLKTLDSKKTYYFKIEAFNENGVTPSSNIIKSE
jgi:xylan 1,4-beta-xylosidase